MNFFILLVVLIAVAFRVVKPDDRARYLAIATSQLRQLRAAAATPRPDYDAFVSALRERTPRLVVVPAIIALNAIVLAGMLFGAGSLADPATYLAWGANLGTRTTNGEWWRLLTAMFLHGGLFLLMLDALVLLQVGAIVERLVGRAALAAVYIAAGVMAGLHHVSAHPVDLGISTAGAIFSVYGLAAACMVWQRVRPAAVTIPATAMKRIGIVGIVFLFLNAIAGFATASELTGFAIGAGCGAVVGWRAGDRMPGMRVVGATAAACLLAVVAYAIPLRSIADVKPAVDRVRVTEARTAAAFKAGVEQVARQRMSPDNLADVAEYRDPARARCGRCAAGRADARPVRARAARRRRTRIPAPPPRELEGAR